MLEVTEAETAYGEQQGIYVLYQKRYKFFLLSLKDFFYVNKLICNWKENPDCDFVQKRLCLIKRTIYIIHM